MAKLQIKKSNETGKVPQPADLDWGELALNYTDGKLFYKKHGTNTVELLNPDTNTVTRLRGTSSGTYTSGDLTLVAGTNITISQNGSDYTIASAGGADSTKLPLAGGTLTGNLLISSVINYIGRSDYTKISFSDGWIKLQATNINTTGYAIGIDATDGPLVQVYNNGIYTNHKLWHAANDGANSGLDADLLDGNHASAFALSGHSHDYLPLAGGTLTGTLTGVSGPTLSFSAGTCAADSYNYVLAAANDSANRLVIFVNGSARSADGGINSVTIRNDAGTLNLGSSSYTTNLIGSSVTTTTATAGTNTTQVATTQFVQTAIANLVNTAPSTLDTLNELATALGNDPNFATTVTNSLANKLSLTGGTLTGALTINANDGVKAVFGGTDGQTWLRGWGLESDRGTAYYRPTGNASQTLRIGYSEASQSWATVRVDATTFTHNGNTVLHSGNHTSYRGTQLVSPNGASVVAADSAMPDSGHSFIHTLALGPSGNDGHILGMTWASTTSIYGAQIWVDTDPTNRMAFRSRSSAGVWTGWNEIIHSNNYTSYSPSLTGSGASGTWGINITGSAATATDSTKLPLAGGIMTGNISFAGSAGLAFGTTTSESGPWNIGVIGSGGATPATKGTGHGRNLIISAGASDNGGGLTGGDLFLRGGAPTAPATVYGDVRIANLGGQVYVRSGAGIVLGSDNYSSYALPLSGGTLTGNLEVTGNNPYVKIRPTSGTVSYLWLTDNSTSGYLLKNTTNATDNGALAGALYTYTDSNKAFQHIHSGTPLFTILSNGNVGIASVTPSEKLEVGGSILVFGSGSSSAGSGTNIWLGPVSNSRDIGIRRGGTAIMAFDRYNGGWYENARFHASGNFSIGNATDNGYKLEVNGSFAATTKSFVITHPTKPGKKLRYGSLEGPENGVYVRGRLRGTKIQLPDYWTGLVDPDSITVQLTAHGRRQDIWVTKIADNCVYVQGTTQPDCYYFIQAERVDVDKLEVELDA